MAKRQNTLKVRLPPYRSPRNNWRKELNREIARAQTQNGLAYGLDDKLEIEARLYLKEGGLAFHDVDNRLKDILDALQGRAGGPKSHRTLKAIIPNDCQIYRAIIEKCAPPRQSNERGHLIIRKYIPSIRRSR